MPPRLGNVTARTWPDDFSAALSVVEWKAADPRVWDEDKVVFEAHNTTSYTSFAKGPQEGSEPRHESGMGARMVKSLDGDGRNVTSKQSTSHSGIERDALARYHGFKGLGWHFDPVNMKTENRTALEGADGKEQELEDEGDEAGVMLQHEPLSTRAGRPADANVAWTVGRAQDRGQQVRSSKAQDAGSDSAPITSTKYVASYGRVLVREDHSRNRPSITTCTEASESEGDNVQGPVRRCMRSRRPCDECGGENGPSRAWLFEIPNHQRRSRRSDSQSETSGADPLEPPEFIDDTYSDVACSTTRPTTPSQGQTGFPTPKLSCEEYGVESEGEDLSHLARTVCRACESRFHPSQSLPFTYLRETETRQRKQEERAHEEQDHQRDYRRRGAEQLNERSADLSTAELWGVIRKHCLHELRQPSAWSRTVRAHELWGDFASRKCLGPSPNDNICWEDKEPGSQYGPSCWAHIKSRKSPVCRTRGCEEDSLTWWISSRASRKSTNAHARGHGSRTFETPLCEACEESYQQRGECFTCRSRLASDDLAGRCEACYESTTLHRDWNKQTALWTSAAGGERAYLLAPWEIIRDERLASALSDDD